MIQAKDPNSKGFWSDLWNNIFGYYEEAPEPTLLMTPAQEEAQSALEELAYGELPTLPTFNLESLEPYNIGLEEIKKVLGEDYNPLTSLFYKGLREASLREEERGVGELRRRSQLGHMLKSDPSARTEAEYRGQMGTGRDIMLGEMYETERNRKMEMIPNLLNYAGLGADVGKFNTQIGIQEALLPYTAQAPIMEGLAGGYGTWYSPEQIYNPGLLNYGLSAANTWLNWPKKKGEA